MGKSTISMAIFNSYVCLPEGKHRYITYKLGKKRVDKIAKLVQTTTMWGPQTIAKLVYNLLNSMVYRGYNYS